jgi:ubiquinol-cytochrome c reductase cytochrome c subunit
MSPPRRSVAVVLSLLALLLSAGAATTTRAAEPPSAVANGRQLYLRVGCWQCHGTVGQGGSAGPRLAPGPMPLEALRAFLRNSVRAMPAYPQTILSDAAIADIHAYLRSLPAAPRAETVPLLRELR